MLITWALVAALAPSSRPALAAGRVYSPLRTVQPICIATTEGDKALLEASKKVTLVAKRFGDMQGKAAQTWVEQAIKGGDASASGLVEMQLALFEDCKLDDGGRCKDLTDAVAALTAAVEDKKSKPKTEGINWQVAAGTTPIQIAATKVRISASQFGLEQQAAADQWIKKVTRGKVADGQSLLEEQIMLFGECVLSEGGTPSNCQQLEEALIELQEAIEVCDISSPSGPYADCSPEEVAVEVAADVKAEVKDGAPAKGRKRDAIKRIWRKATGKA